MDSGVDHGRQIATHGFEGFADRARGQGDVTDDAGMAWLVLGAKLQAELPISQDVGANFQKLQIADERYPPVRISQVLGLEPGAAQGFTRMSPARPHIGVEAVGDAGQIDGRRGELGRGASFRRHWRDLAKLWRSISRPTAPLPTTSRDAELGLNAGPASA